MCSEWRPNPSPLQWCHRVMEEKSHESHWVATCGFSNQIKNATCCFSKQTSRQLMTVEKYLLNPFSIGLRWAYSISLVSWVCRVQLSLAYLSDHSNKISKPITEFHKLKLLNLRESITKSKLYYKLSIKYNSILIQAHQVLTIQLIFHWKLNL